MNTVLQQKKRLSDLIAANDGAGLKALLTAEPYLLSPTPPYEPDTINQFVRIFLGGQLEVLTVLLDHGFSPDTELTVNALDYVTGRPTQQVVGPLLLWAFLGGDAPGVDLLINRGASVTDPRVLYLFSQNLGKSNWYQASYQGQIAALHRLLSAGADVNATDQWGYTLYQWLMGRQSELRHPFVDRIPPLLEKSGVNAAVVRQDTLQRIDLLRIECHRIGAIITDHDPYDDADLD
jgi:hypothetical protein